MSQVVLPPRRPPAPARSPHVTTASLPPHNRVPGPGAVVDGPAASVILPAYNEAAALPTVLMALFAVLDESCEVIVVDDGSSDETAAIARGFPCRVIRHQRNSGKGAALRTGLAAARGRAVVVMDADNTYPAEAIPQLVKLLDRYDLVRGVRRHTADSSPLLNRLGNQLFDLSLTWLYGLEGGDYLTGLYGFSRRAIEAIEFTADGFDIEVEIGIKARALELRTAAVPISYHARLGEKKLRALRDGWRILSRMGALALIYNPVASFIVPGLLLWGLSLLLVCAGAISAGGVSAAGALGAVIGALVCGQLLIFGLAAALYGIERGMAPRPWILGLSRPGPRWGMGFAGGLLLLAGLIASASAVHAHLGGATIGYLGERYLIASVLLALGAQTLAAALFVGIFAGRLEQRAAGQPAPLVLEPLLHTRPEEVL